MFKEDSKEPRILFEKELKELAIKHNVNIFYMVRDDNDDKILVGTNDCIQCLKPIIEGFFSCVENHDESKGVKH